MCLSINITFALSLQEIPVKYNIQYYYISIYFQIKANRIMLRFSLPVDTRIARLTPRMRGIHNCGGHRFDFFGITPAHAGKIRAAPTAKGNAGITPHMRGTFAQCDYADHQLGITPACAGKTPFLN
jgi:hypothetical protein